MKKYLLLFIVLLSQRLFAIDINTIKTDSGYPIYVNFSNNNILETNNLYNISMYFDILWYTDFFDRLFN